jgi:heptaprenyl diphosphate synthase
MDKTLNKSADRLKKTKILILTGLLFAISIILSIVENSLPPLPIAVPGVKLGLSNIAVMYALFFLGKKRAFAIAVLKSLFIFATRGMISGFLSLTGGIMSLIIMTVLMLIFKENISYLIISVSGAVFHNIGQFIAISFIYVNLFIWAYLPVLIISGIAAGIATSTLLKFILPAFKKLGLK